jgi:hypothetical protein
VDETYIRPEDVSPADARRVLVFLNSAQSAEQIAKAVEIPDELDVGLRVAQRILDRREELSAFTSLQQVADVPQVGPERFTEIVVTVGALGTSEPQATLVQEVRALRETVEVLQSALGTRHRATLISLRDQPFLGQPVTIVATVTDIRGATPRVGAPVTFAASWGRLRSVGDLTVQQGGTVTARTGADGTARVTLLPPTSEDLPEPQQRSLETMLRLLDAGALTPRDTGPGLREMVRRYRWEANVDFRRAVDVYFRDFRHRLLDTVNHRDYTRAWSYFDATVTMYVRGDVSETAVQATAAHTLHFKDWLAPWLETYLELSESESTLGDDLQDAKERGGEAGPLVQDIYGRVREFVAGERGLVGEYAGRKVAGASLGRFLESDLGDLPLEDRIALFPALKVAADTVDTAGLNVLTAVGQTRAEVRQEFTDKIGRVDTAGIHALATRLQDVEMQLSVKVDATEFDGFRSEISDGLAAKVDRTSFDRALATKVDGTAFSRELGSLRGKVVDLESEVFRG